MTDVAPQADHTTLAQAQNAEDQPNMFLRGPFAPVKQEITSHDLQVTGKIPDDLVGRLLRIGPNPIDPEDPDTYNWFCGNGMVHGVRIRDGKAEWYRNRFVRDDRVSTVMGEERIPGPDPLKGYSTIDHNIINTHVWAQGGKTYAFNEAGALPVEISYELDTIRRTDFDGTLRGSWTAHPHRDPDTNELHGLAYYMGWDYVCYQVLDVTGRIRHSVEIPVPSRPIVHDMALTENYVAFLDGALVYDDELVAAGAPLPARWNASSPSRWGLIPRDGTGDDVKWFDVEPVWTSHILNAFETSDGRIAIDCITHDRVMDQDLTGPSESASNLDRYFLDPESGRITMDRLDDRYQEMPRMDERLTGREHRYGYMSSRGGSDDGSYVGVSRILKHDLKNGTASTFEHGPGRFGMEAVFIPRTPDSSEDDGWLMTYVADMTNNTTDVVIVHAQALDEEPEARIHIPQRVPIGFHGNWVADAELAAGSVPA